MLSTGLRGLLTSLPILLLKSAPSTAQKTGAQRNTVTAKVSHHFIPVHRQKRVQRPRSLLHELVPLATCSHGRFRICTKGTCYRIQEVPGSNSALTVGPPAERGHHSCSPPPHPKKGADCQLPGSKNKDIFPPKSICLLIKAAAGIGL